MQKVHDLIVEGLTGVYESTENPKSTESPDFLLRVPSLAVLPTADRLTAAIVAGYDGVPVDHSLEHITVVARNALGAMTWKYSAVEKLILIISALGHDISDSKFDRYAERWHEFVIDLEKIFCDIGLSDRTPWIVFIIQHVGVSKEAGRDYTIVRSQDEWRALAKEVTPDFDTLVAIRHTVSSADIVEALGEYGHVRAVTHNGRLCTAAGLTADTPEFIAEVFKGVTWVHKHKHQNLCRWIHNPALRDVAISRWDEMVLAYRTWSEELGFVPEELTLVM
jgi:hypothetical protein